MCRIFLLHLTKYLKILKNTNCLVYDTKIHTYICFLSIYLLLLFRNNSTDDGAKSVARRTKGINKTAPQLVSIIQYVRLSTGANIRTSVVAKFLQFLKLEITWSIYDKI